MFRNLTGLFFFTLCICVTSSLRAENQRETIRLSNEEKEQALQNASYPKARTVESGILPTISAKYGHPREWYGTLGLVANFGEIESKDQLHGFLIEGTYGQNDFGGSLGYCLVKDVTTGGLLAGKMTFLRGLKENIDDHLHDQEDSLGIEASIAVMLFSFDFGLFRNLDRNDWYPTVGIGLGF